MREETEMSLADLGDFEDAPVREYTLPVQAGKKKPRGMYEYVKPEKRTAKRADYDIHNIRPVEDLRQPSVRGGFDEGLYNSLVNVLLNHKKEIRKVPAVTINQARRYAKNRGKGFRAAEVDMNPEDGLNEKEVVVYNQAGQPVVINGYKLTPSRYPYRRDYELDAEKHGGFHDLDDDGIPDYRANKREWFNSKYGYKEGDNIWDNGTLKREKVPAFEAYSDIGYAKYAKPRNVKSVYQIFSKLFAPVLKKAYEANGLTILNKLFPPLLICQSYYLAKVVIPYATMNGITSYDAFSMHLKSDQGKEDFKTWFITNFIPNGIPSFESSDVDEFFATTTDITKGVAAFDYFVNNKDVRKLQSILVNSDGTYVKINEILRGLDPQDAGDKQRINYWITQAKYFDTFKENAVRRIKNFNNDLKGRPISEKSITGMTKSMWK